MRKQRFPVLIKLACLPLAGFLLAIPSMLWWPAFPQVRADLSDDSGRPSYGMDDASVRKPARIDRATCQAIEHGMTLASVTKLLGGPPGHYRTRKVHLDLDSDDAQLERVKFDNIMLAPEVLLGELRIRFQWWEGNEGTLWVCFDKKNCVIDYAFIPCLPR